MKLTIATVICSVLLLAFACEEESEISSSIEGRWKGTLAEGIIRPFGLPIPVSKDDPSFDAEIEFRSDGVLMLLDDSQTPQGTYQVTGDKLVIDIDFSIEGQSLSGTYDIETLTETTLVISIKKRDAVVDPDGAPAIRGTIKITLQFQRA